MRFQAAAVLVAIAGCGRVTSPPPARAPVVAAGDGCASCHVEEARTWEASLHHRAFTDADFQASFAREPESLCVGCHAPNASSKDDPRVAEGVSCVTCHATAAGAHPVGPAKSCDGCHDFAAPTGVLALQKTATEHARSPLRDSSCASCHVSAHDHGFAAGHDLDRLRGAVALDASWTDAGRVEVRITPERIGHAFPSGDLFRRVRVFAYRETEDGRILVSAEKSFERTFEPGPGTRREHADERIEGVTRFSLDLGATVDEPGRVVVQLIYERGATRVGDDLSLFSSDVLHERTLELKR